MTNAHETSIDCDKLEEFISVSTIIELNKLITEPESYLEEGYSSSTHKFAQSISELDLGREEDWHQVRHRGIIETLITTMLPLECRQDNNALNLGIRILSHLASHQAFSEGNKRTAYLSFVLFFTKAQLEAGIEVPDYPMLDKPLTEDISKLAIEHETTNKKGITEKDIKNIIKKRLD